MRGKPNEDRFATTSYTLSETDDTPSLFAIVADGVGGHLAGDIAAELAVNTITHEISGADGSEPLIDLANAVQLANRRIFQQAERQMEQHGMGSTCVCAWVIGSRLYTVSIGDSRLYLIRDGEIHQLSTDHTWVQEAMERGILTPSQAQSHPRSHIIRRYLGAPDPVDPDFRMRLSPGEDNQTAEANQGLILKQDDIIVLCSDGLSDLVEAYEIKQQFESYSLDSAVSSLITLANQRGGHDNITITALKAPAAIRAWQRNGKESWLDRLPLWVPISCLGSFFLLVAIIVVGIVFLLRNDEPVNPDPTASIIPAAATDILENTTTSLPAIENESTPVPSPTPPLITYTPWPTATQDSSP